MAGYIYYTRTPVNSEASVLDQASRPDPAHLSFGEYICKGKIYLRSMRAARPDPLRWVYNKLVHNGWKIEDGDPYDLGSEALKAVQALKIPTEKGKNLEITAVSVNKFLSFQQNIKVHIVLLDSPC